MLNNIRIILFKMYIGHKKDTIWIYERGHNLCIPTIYGTCIPWFPTELYTDIITIHIFSTISHIHKNMVPGIYSTGRSKINIQIACTCRYTIWQQCHSLLKYRYFIGVKVKEETWVNEF